MDASPAALRHGGLAHGPAEPGPRHVAVILDGNRRWADRHGHSPLRAYQCGGERVLELLRRCESVAGLETVTLWPLSTENLRRGDRDLAGLLTVILDTTRRIAAGRRWRLRFIGALDLLPARVAQALDAGAARTADVRDRVVNIAVADGGHDEIARGVRDLIAAHHADGTVDLLARELSPALIERHLDTAGQPHPDLVIRTSGEQRLSGLMLRQAAYAELYFTPTLWPDFDHTEFSQALDWYALRSRRYGR